MTSCEDIIDTRLRRRLADLRVLQTIANGGTPDTQAFHERFPDVHNAEDAEDALDTYGLGMYGNNEDDDDVFHVTLELSTGGPADRFVFYPSASGNAIVRIVYHYSDWFDHAEREITDDDDIATLVSIYGEAVSMYLDEYRGPE